MKPLPPATLRYRIQPKNPAAHLYEVTVNILDPAPAGQQFMLPTWIPGSYMIREFARHVVSIRAKAGERVIGLRKIDKATWQCEAVHEPISITYEIYAWDLSVRGAHLDETHGFFNGACVFLLPVGFENAACDVEIVAPAGEKYAAWRIATSLCQSQALVRPAGRKRSARCARWRSAICFAWRVLWSVRKVGASLRSSPNGRN